MALFLLVLFALSSYGGYALFVYLGKRNDTDPKEGAGVDAVLGPAGGEWHGSYLEGPSMAIARRPAVASVLRALDRR